MGIKEIAFGCMSLKPDNSDAINILQKAASSGITLFDTADLYDQGLNEALVGHAFSSKREKVQIATKVGNEWNSKGTDWRWNPGKEYILKAVEQSLKRLKTDYIDIYELHGGTIDDPIDETIEAFELLKDQGKILNYGISSIRPNVIREWVKKSSMSYTMMQYSLLDRRPEEECLDLLAKANVKVLTRGTLAKGILLSKQAEEYLGYSESEVQKLKNVICNTENQMATSIQFVNKHPAVEAAVLGIRTMKQLDDVIKAQSIKIPDSTLLSLGEVLRKNVYTNHR